MQYEVDEFVSPEYGDDSINLNCVLSWRLRNLPDGEVGDPLQIDLHNGWAFGAAEAGKWFRRDASLRERTLEHLRRLSDDRRIFGEPRQPELNHRPRQV